MRDIAFESVLEVLTLVAEAVGVVALTALGILAERAGLSHLSSGLDPLTVWFFGMGAVALYGGVYMLGYQTVLPQLFDRLGGSRS